jgi:hypothetical protein
MGTARRALPAERGGRAAAGQRRALRGLSPSELRGFGEKCVVYAEISPRLPRGQALTPRCRPVVARVLAGEPNRGPHDDRKHRERERAAQGVGDDAVEDDHGDGARNPHGDREEESGEWRGVHTVRVLRLSESAVRALAYLRGSTPKNLPWGDDGVDSLAENPHMSPTAIRALLMDVARERLRAERVTKAAAVTQLAVLRGQLYGRLLG